MDRSENRSQEKPSAIRYRISLGLGATVAVAIVIAALGILILEGAITHTRVIFLIELFNVLAILGVGGTAVFLSRSLVRLYETSENNLIKLQHSEAATKRIIDSALDCIISINKKGEIIEFNPAAERTFGYRRNEILGKNLAETIIPASLRCANDAGMQRYLSTDVSTILNRQIEMTAIRKNAQEFPIELAVIKTQTLGDPIFTGFLRDITVRKQAEESKNLAIRARDDLIATVSHELKNPLTTVGTSVELLRKSESDLIAKSKLLQKSLMNISVSVQRMTRLVSDLLDIARLEAGRVVLEIDLVKVNDLVKEVLETFRPLAQQKGIRIENEPISTTEEIYCDRGRMIQVLSNLLSNAIKFTSSGGIVSLDFKKLDRHVLFSVRDNGPGIAKDQLPMIFSRFWQANQSNHSGTGLGLSIAKGIVETHGGKIWVESKVGIGTVFYYTLPNKSIQKIA